MRWPLATAGLAPACCDYRKETSGLPRAAYYDSPLPPSRRQMTRSPAAYHASSQQNDLSGTTVPYDNEFEVSVGVGRATMGHQDFDDARASMLVRLAPHSNQPWCR